MAKDFQVRLRTVLTPTLAFLSVISLFSYYLWNDKQLYIVIFLVLLVFLLIRFFTYEIELRNDLLIKKQLLSFQQYEISTIDSIEYIIHRYGNGLLIKFKNGRKPRRISFVTRDYEKVSLLLAYLFYKKVKLINDGTENSKSMIQKSKELAIKKFSDS